MTRRSVRLFHPDAQAPAPGHPFPERTPRHAPPFLFAVLLVLAAASPPAAAQSIVNVAGGGNDEGLPAGKVALHPTGIDFDAKGNLVYADQFNGRIRMIDAATGIVRTLAGVGSAGLSGDGGPATRAELFMPLDVAFDAAGNLYIADTTNLRIRRVSPDGLIATVAGGGTVSPPDGVPGTLAALTGPTALVVDPAGFLYFAEYSGAAVRKLDLATGLLSTIAGTGERTDTGDGGPATKATFVGPWGIARDSSGRLYVADIAASRVRRIDSSGTISTYAGTGQYGDSGDGGPATLARLGYPAGLAIDGSGNLLIADADSARIRRVDAATGVISTVAGTGETGFAGDGGPATLAQLDYPSAVDLDPEGRIVVADEFNARIRRIEKDGTIRTLAGTGSFTVVRDGGPATSAGVMPYALCFQKDGTLLIGEQYGYRVRAVDPVSGVIRTIAGTGRAGNPGDGGPATRAQIGAALGLAIDRSGGILVADPDNHKVRRIDPVTGILTTFAGTGAAGRTGDGGPATLATLRQPKDMAVDAAGNVYIVDTSAKVVRQVDARSGIISTVAGGGTESPGDGGPALAAKLVIPQFLAIDPTGSLLIADLGDNRVRKVSLGVISTVAGDGTREPFVDGVPATQTAVRPLGIDVDAEGNLYVAGGFRVRKVDARTGLVSTIAGSGARSSLGDGGPATAAGVIPQGLRVSASGDVYIADYYGLRVRMIPRCRTVDGPALIAPANGQQAVPAAPVLSWTPVAGAFRYDVVLDTANPPGKIVSADLAGTTFTADNLSAGTTYFWQVVAKGDPYCTPRSTAASAVRAFTTQSGCAPPAAPVLASPANGATGVSTSATLSWQPSSGAGTYDLYFGSTNPPPLRAAGLATLSFSPGGLVASATYFWSVRAHAACDATKTSSSPVSSFRVAGGACASPGAFSLSLPADGATGVPTEVTFSWTASAGATSYDLHLGLGGTLPLYLAGIGATSLSVPGLSAGATYTWKVVARTSCDTSLAVPSAVRSFTVAGVCAAPGATSFAFVPPGNVASGQTYVLAWRDAPGLDAGGGYLVERSYSSTFSPLLDTQTVSTDFAAFVAPAPGSVFHRVRAVAGCDPSKAAPPSPAVSVAVVAARPNVVFTVSPSAVVTSLGDSLEDRKTSFTIENISTSPLQVIVAQKELGSVPFFQVVDPEGGDTTFVTLQPRKPKSFDIRFSGPPGDKPASYQGLVVLASTGQGLAVTPYAFVNLKVGGSSGAAPEFRIGGERTEYVFFPGFSGEDSTRPPITVDVYNPGTTPMELAAEIGPEVWLAPEAGWNAQAVPPHGMRSIRLLTNRSFAPNGSALPRYTYFTLRTVDGLTARLLVQDNDAPALGPARSAPLERSTRSFVIPSVVKATSAIGNTFVSRVRLSNAGTEPVQADLYFTPASTSDGAVDGFDPAFVKRATVVVPPGDLVSLTDPLVQLFGLTAPVAGALEVQAAPEKVGFLTVTSAVDAPARSGGTFGFQMPTFSRGEGARAGRAHVVTGITSTASQRTNLILAETTGLDGVSVRVALRDRDGDALGETFVAIPRYGQRQINSVVESLDGSVPFSAGCLDIEVLSGGGAVAAVVTVIDNVNDDASTVAGRPVESGAQTAAARLAFGKHRGLSAAPRTATLLVPAIVNGFRTFPGSSEPYTFRSLMAFTSGTKSAAGFRLTYRDLVSGKTLERSVTVGGRQTVEYPNVVEELFGLPAGAASQGPVTIEADLNGIVTCRVYSELARGSLGDAFPVLPIPSEGLTGGDSRKPLVVDGLEQSVDGSRGTRSNLILNEVLGQPVVVNVRLYEAGNRAAPIAERDVEVAPFEKRQLSTVFTELGLNSPERRKDRTNVQLVVTPVSGPGMVSAVVTTIDNQTGDTRNVVVAPSGGSPGAGTGIGL